MYRIISPLEEQKMIVKQENSQISFLYYFNPITHVRYSEEFVGIWLKHDWPRATFYNLLNLKKITNLNLICGHNCCSFLCIVQKKDVFN